MANALYPLWKEAVIQGASDSSLAGTVKAALIDTGVYTYNAAHQFFSSVSGVIGTPGVIGATKTYALGVFDGADVTYTAVTGNTAEALLIYIDTGNPATSRLVAWLDTGYTNLPVTPNGGNITIAWDSAANKIFAI